MKRTKIAPHLGWFVYAYGPSEDIADKTVKSARRQFRALELLATAAVEWSNTPADANRKQTVDDRLMRAIRNLEKASQP